MSIKIEHLTHTYMQDSPFESTAIRDICLEINDGEFVGLIGHTGSGKSTLIQHLNGLLKPTEGTVIVNGFEIMNKSRELKAVRQQVGLVFQYPEHQLFEETVFLDVAFGPKNLQLKEDEIELRVKEAIELVGLDYEGVKDRSPFELSGGQRRRVAIAGVLAMKPGILILDEPTAGLDPRGRQEILTQIKKLHEREKNTIILVSHSMEDIARLVQRILVMNKGRLALTGTPTEVFTHSKELEEMGLGIPQITSLMMALKGMGENVPENIYTVDRAYEVIKGLIGGCRHA